MSNIFDPIFKVHSACMCVLVNVFQTYTRHKLNIGKNAFFAVTMNWLLVFAAGNDGAGKI